MLTNLMLQYLNVLIHHLLQAGKQLQTTSSYDLFDIDLVVFRVSDLMRSKLQCTEASFISLLKTFYLLESHPSTQQKVKIVRIKNRLDIPANDIMINYLFMGRVQCELQLSIQESKGKEKNYFTFSHFVYELTRGKFGVIAELAIMVSQLDPMIVASRGPYYTEKREVSLIRPSLRKAEAKDDKQKKLQIKVSDSTYECSSCRKLIIGEKNGIFKKEDELTDVCNHCIISKNSDAEKYLSDEALREGL